MTGQTSSSLKDGHFTTTHWSVVLAARTAASPDYKEALSSLCETYWFPIYAYLRGRGYTSHEAEDHTQGFLATLMEKQGLHSVDPEKGRFRSYLLGALKHYLADARDQAQTQKQGGGYKIVSLDARNFENRLNLESDNELSPEQLFDRKWALTILQRSIHRLEEESAGACESNVTELIIRYLVPSSESVPYKVTAAELSMSEAAVKTAVYRLRRRYRELLIDEIAQTVAAENEVEDEIRHLFAALSAC